MKFLVLVLVLGVAYMVWRNNRVAAKPPPPRPKNLAAPQEMVVCAHCGVHVPQNEAWVRDGRSYCSAGHQKRDGR